MDLQTPVKSTLDLQSVLLMQLFRLGFVCGWDIELPRRAVLQKGNILAPAAQNPLFVGSIPAPVIHICIRICIYIYAYTYVYVYMHLYIHLCHTSICTWGLSKVLSLGLGDFRRPIAELPRVALSILCFTTCSRLQKTTDMRLRRPPCTYTYI